MVGTLTVKSDFGIFMHFMNEPLPHSVYRTTGSLLVFVLAAAIAVTLVAAGCGKSPGLALREYKDQSDQARSLLVEGQAAKALEIARGLLAQQPQPEYDSVRAETALIAAACEERLGRYEAALDDFRTSMEFTREAMDQRLERVNKLALARYYMATDEPTIARRLAHEAAAGARVFSDSAFMADALRLSAQADGRSGETDRALRTVTDLERMGRTDRIELARLRFDILLASGRDAETRAFLASWKAAEKDASRPRGAMMAAYCAGRFQEAIGHADSALAAYSSALGSLDLPADTLFAPELFASLGDVAYRLRHYPDARRYYADARDQVKRSGDRFAEPMLTIAIAACDWKSARPGAGAKEIAARCAAELEACRATHHQRGEALALFLLGAIAEQGGEDSVALASYRAGRDIAELLPVSAGGEAVAERLSSAILDGEQSGWFEAPARLCAASGDATAAFEENERATLHDITTFFFSSSFRPPDDASRALLDSLRWVRKLQGRCARETERELASGGADQEHMGALLEVSSTLRARVDAALQAFSSASRNLRWILTERAVSARAVRDSLPDGAALLSYIVAPKQLSVLVLRRDTILVRTIEIDRTRLLGMIGEYNRLLGDPRTNADGTPAHSPGELRRIRDLSGILANSLLDPVGATVRGASTLTFVPPAEFGWLPFHALRVGRPDGATEALYESRVVKYLPSAASLFCVPVADRPVQTVAGFGHAGATGWDVEYELRDIRSFFDKTVIVSDTAATLARLARTSADVVHVAADIALDTDVPDRSVLTLSEGPPAYGLTRVPLASLAGVPPVPTLLVSNIAAVPGGLCRYAPALFLADGNRTVLLAMWRGDRRAKRYFGEIFYTSVSTGLPSGESFRSALLSMLKKGEFTAEGRWGLYFQYGR
jgi:tetratricopeptide (TPR) repeat protein